MPEQFGALIDIPDYTWTASDVFPFQNDWDVARTIGFEYAILEIGFLKEQRALKAIKGSRWSLGVTAIHAAELDDFWDFYDNHRDPTILFTFYDPLESEGVIDLTGAEETGRYTARFANNDLTFDQFTVAFRSGRLEVIEVEIDPDHSPTISFDHHTFETVATTVNFPERKYPFPASLEYSEFTDYGDGSWSTYGATVHLLHYLIIQPRVASDPWDNTNTIRIADKRVTFEDAGNPSTFFDGLYQPYLISWDIQEELGSNSSARFVVDNKNGVWTDFMSQISLNQANVWMNVWLTTHPLNLWGGVITDITIHREDRTVELECSPLRKGLTLPFPHRLVQSSCPLDYKGTECAAVSAEVTCNKSLEDCIIRSNEDRFQGVVIKPQEASGKIAKSGFLGLFKKSYTTTSTPFETIYGQTIPIVYLGNDKRLIIQAEIFEVRDESEFFVATGMVGEGPMGQSATDTGSNVFGQALLDGYAQHPGYSPLKVVGTIPATTGTQIDSAFRSARFAFVGVRRVDETGLQTIERNHVLMVEVKRGIYGYVPFWDGGNVITVVGGPVGHVPHAMLDILNRCYGARSTVTQVSLPFIVNFLIDSQGYREAMQNLGGFELAAYLKEPKQAIETIYDLARSARISVTWAYGLLRPKIRIDEVTDFVYSNGRVWNQNLGIVLNTFDAVEYKPQFNDLTLIFPDADYDFQQRDVSIYSIDHQKLMGSDDVPLPMKSSMNLVGLVDRTKAIELGFQYLREELGGATAEEWRKARHVSFVAPLTGLADMVGEVSKVVHSDLPDGELYVRMVRWRYTSDLRVELGFNTERVSYYNTDDFDQTPSDLSGDPVTGIPGGSQGADGSENVLQTVTAPTIATNKITYRTALIGVDAVPTFARYLVYQISTSSGFGTFTETTIGPPIHLTFEIGGSANTTRYLRAKWVRTAAVVSPAIAADESAWSNTLTLVFPLIDAATETNVTAAGIEVKEIDGTPDVTGVTIVRVSNTRLTNDGGGQVTIDVATVAGHHTSHELSGGDAIKLDDLSTPDDNTDLNSSTSQHGLLRKLSGVGTDFLNGSGGWTAPAGAGNAAVVGGAIHQHLTKPTTTGYDTLGYSALAFTTVGTNANGDVANGAYNKYTTNAAATARAGINGGTSNWLQTRWNPTSVFVFEIDTIATIRMFIGWADQDINALASSDPTAQLAMFRYDTGVDSSGQLAIITNDGSGGGTITTNVASIAANTRYTAMIVSRAAGTAIDFYWNGTLVGTHSTNLPTATTTIGYSCMITTLANVAAVLRYSRDALYY